MQNQTGIRPTEYKVLVKPKAAEEKTAGGILIPDMTKDKEKYATTEGQIIDLSPLAFSYVPKDEWGEHCPKVGDRVLYAKYAGLHRKGGDGVDYILVNDKDIVATIEE